MRLGQPRLESNAYAVLGLPIPFLAALLVCYMPLAILAGQKRFLALIVGYT